MSHIAIITVVYKNYTVLEDYLNSLRKQLDINFHLFVADASPQPQHINTEGLSLTVLPIENKGYAHGINTALKKTQDMGYTHFCVTNDDVYFKNSFTKNLASSFKRHKNSIFGGKIYYANGYEFHKNRYSKNERGTVIWYAGGKVDWNNATTKHIGVDQIEKHQFDTESKTDFITGCLMCFDSKVVNKLGYWDEDYFLYYEDADYCERAKQNNINLWYDPSIEIWHKNAQSTDGSGSKLHENFQKNSQLKFALKYAPFKTKLHVLKNYFI